MPEYHSLREYFESLTSEKQARGTTGSWARRVAEATEAPSVGGTESWDERIAVAQGLTKQPGGWRRQVRGWLADAEAPGGGDGGGTAGLALVGSTVNDTQHSTALASIELTTPADIATGDVLVATLARNGSSTLATPSGWTLLDTHKHASVTTSPVVTTFIRQVTDAATEPASHIFAASEFTLRLSGVMLAVRGVDFAAIAAPSWGETGGTIVTTVDAPSVSPTGDALLVVVAQWARTASYTMDMTPDAAMTQAQEVISNYTPQNVATEMVVSGATGTRTVTCNLAGHGMAGALVLSASA